MLLTLLFTLYTLLLNVNLSEGIHNVLIIIKKKEE